MSSWRRFPGSRLNDDEAPLSIYRGEAPYGERPMAIHTHPRDLFFAAVKEYLKASKLCLRYRKDDGGILGYPATLMLCCIIDAMSNNLKRSEKQKLTGDTFRILRHHSFGLQLTDEQFSKVQTSLGGWFRHKLAHQLVIVWNVALEAEGTNTTPFGFSSSGDFDTIYVLPLYRMVEKAWRSIDKSYFDEIGGGLEGPKVPATGLTTAPTTFTTPPSGAISGSPKS
jgi:hypothetical protein